MTGGCVLAAGCAGYDSRTAQPAITDSDTAPLCPECLRRSTQDLAALPADYADLGRELIPHERGLRHDARHDDDRAAPLALDVDALQREIFWALTVWEPPVREAAGLPPEQVRGVRPAWAVARAAAVVAPRARLLAGLGPTWGYAEGVEVGPVARDGAWALTRLRGLHRLARAACGLTRRVYRLPGECSGCGAGALFRADGGDTVWCRACDARWTYADYQRYVGLMLEAIG